MEGIRCDMETLLISEPQFEFTSPRLGGRIWTEMPALPPADVKFKYRLYLKDFQVIYK